MGLTELALCVIVRDDGTTRSTHKKPKEDTFGQNDEDWMVYRSIVSESVQCEALSATNLKARLLFNTQRCPFVNALHLLV